MQLDHPSENAREARLILMYILIREQADEGGQRDGRTEGEWTGGNVERNS